MPKAAKAKSKSKKVDTPLRQRKFAVSEKEVIEKIVINGQEISTVDLNQKEITKKDTKKKLRHEAWLEKLDNSYAVKKKQQKKQQQKKSGVTMDLDDFDAILNSIELKPKSESSQAARMQKNTTPQEAVIPSNKIKSKKSKKKAEMQEILRMQKVMQHSAFQQNPLETIRQHVQNKFTNE
ncbi:hypothetical protein K501DRAFT_337368 [Backusella circina FSU 941]|nr:hypothetical protein K501DRAFT_337368 [Backusella circina FSU 941]